MPNPHQVCSLQAYTTRLPRETTQRETTQRQASIFCQHSNSTRSLECSVTPEETLHTRMKPNNIVHYI